MAGDFKPCEGHKRNFDTLQKAFANGDACILECFDKLIGEKVAVICAANREEDGSIAFVPFAALHNGNPYERFLPPDPEGGFASEEGD